MRYAIICTEKITPEDTAIHWLRKGTVVQIVGEGEVECINAVYPVDVAHAQMGRRKHRQFINPEDCIEFSTEGITL